MSPPQSGHQAEGVGGGGVQRLLSFLRRPISDFWTRYTQVVVWGVVGDQRVAGSTSTQPRHHVGHDKLAEPRAGLPVRNEPAAETGTPGMTLPGEPGIAVL